MKMLKLVGLCACVISLALFCGKNKVTNPGGNQPGTVFDYSDTLALRAILDANGLTTISAGSPSIAEIRLVGGNVHRIYKLMLGNKGITVIPARIKDLTALEILQLDTNSITVLPAEIRYCTALIRIQLSNNQLATLPSEISDLHSLQSLVLSHNSISSLPASLWTITSLTVLRLDNNSLSDLSADISNLVNLATLTLNNNALTTLPQSLTSITALQWIEINNNHICANTLDPTFVGWLDIRAEQGWQTTQGVCP